MDNKMFKLMNLRGKGHKSLIEDLDLYIGDLIDSNKRLNEKLANFNKDEEILNLKNRIDNLSRNSIHIMSDKEKVDEKAFRDEHYNSCNSNIEYILVGTGIGTATSVRCKKCGTVKDITDHDNW